MYEGRSKWTERAFRVNCSGRFWLAADAWTAASGTNISSKSTRSGGARWPPGSRFRSSARFPKDFTPSPGCVVVGEDSSRRGAACDAIEAGLVVASAGDAAAGGRAPDEQSIVVRSQNAGAPIHTSNRERVGTAARLPLPPLLVQQLFDNASAAAESAWNQNVAAPADSRPSATRAKDYRTRLVAPVQQGINDAANQFQSVGQNVQGRGVAGRTGPVPPTSPRNR